MPNRYSVNRAQEELQQQQKKQRSKQEQADAAIQEEVARIERQNYQEAKQARLKLEQSALTQKEATDEMRRQGEKIHKTRRAALKVHDNADEAEELAESIERESHMFKVSPGWWGSVKKWWKKDSREEGDVNRVRQAIEEERGAAPEDDQEEAAVANTSDEEALSEPSGEEEYIQGQRRTDSELRKILKVTQKIRREAEAQSTIAKKQTTNLKDINELNEYSKKKVDKTDSELKKGL